MKKLLGILVLGLFLIIPISRSYAEISDTCYKTELDKAYKENAHISYSAVRFSIAKNGSIYIEVDTKRYYYKNKDKDEYVKKIFDKYVDVVAELAASDGASGLAKPTEIMLEEMHKLNPFANGKIEFTPYKKDFWDTRHVAGGVIQTVKKLSSHNKDVLEFWNFDLNEGEAVSNLAWTPEFVAEWNNNWDQLSYEKKKEYNRLSTRPYHIVKFTNCKNIGKIDSNKTPEGSEQDQQKYWWVVVLIVLMSFFIYTQTVKTMRGKKNRKS